MIVVVPMAGRGSRYSRVGYELPKPLIPVAGKPMILWALESLKHFPVSQFVFIILKEHEEMYNVQSLLKQHVNSKISFVLLEEITEGQLCTVMAAKDSIDSDEDVLISASDTLVEGNVYADAQGSHWDGLISVANLAGDQWSFAKTNDIGEVIAVTEKVRISENASTGQYYFRHGRDLVRFGTEMMTKKEMTRGEYYVIPVYQKMIDAGHKIGISKASAMWDLGTPEAKLFFETNYKSI